ncbi:hypothetical protein [Microcoleus sp. N9_B4]
MKNLGDNLCEKPVILSPNALPSNLDRAIALRQDILFLGDV